MALKTLRSVDLQDEGPARKIHKSSTSSSEREKKLFTSSQRRSVIKYYENVQKGCQSRGDRYSIKLSLINQIKNFRIIKSESPFDRRVTFIEWHPKNPRLLAAASKGGDIILWNCDQSIDVENSVKGIGAGGSVQAMKFDSIDPYKLFTVSIEGKFLVLNFKTKRATEFLDTQDYKKWYVSLDINWGSKTMVVGDNKGYLTILTTEGKIVDTLQLHKGRVTHAEFSRREPWLLCTSSNDNRLKLWDIRNIKKGQGGVAMPLHSIEHKKPLNAAYFSLTDGCRLLTTDQFDKIHVYRSPLWNMETEISHPHRQFQHLTQIRAYWHPLEDIILVGRYPHVDFPGYTPGEVRSIDFFDADTGELLHQHSESGFNGIAVLNRFNVAGDVLATASGCKIMIWKQNYKALYPIELKYDADENKKVNKFVEFPKNVDLKLKTKNTSKKSKGKLQ